MEEKDSICCETICLGQGRRQIADRLQGYQPMTSGEEGSGPVCGDWKRKVQG